MTGPVHPGGLARYGAKRLQEAWVLTASVPMSLRWFQVRR